METKLRPLAVGSSLAVTMAIVYALCTAAWITWQTEAVNFLNELFHGLDFRRIQVESSYSVMAFIAPLAVLSLWGFVTGTLYGLIYNALTRE